MSALILLVTVSFAGSSEASVDFHNEIVPVLTKAGCNTGACHGAAVGRGGFKLSLYGGDPESDYRSIVLDLEGRRVNLAWPDDSLIVLKPTESIAHGGGYRLEDDGAGANLFRKWIHEGARPTQKKRLQQFQVSPKLHIADRVNSVVQLKATADYSDGSSVDVTQWTVFTAEDPSAVKVDPETATATLLRRGRHIVIARYLDRVVPLEMIAPLTDEVVDLTDQPRHNFIDDHVMRLLSILRIPISGQADDVTFLRRATLDLTGRLPTLEAINEFKNNSSVDKRTALIDALLNSNEFTEYWTLQLAKLLRVRSQPQDAKGAKAYHVWLRRQVAASMPYDEMARQILTAVGDTHKVGPANFFRTVAGPREQAEFASELFMGSRLRCANCHNHPLDRWTQDDYHGLAAVFAKLERGKVVKVSMRGEVTHPRTRQAAVPRIPGERFLEGSGDGRQAFASWLTDRDNPYFAKAIVNRLWKALMGRGLVEPNDDFRDSNPPTHPKLLNQLANDFVEHGYDLRHTLRRIALSAAYARSSRMLPENRTDDRYYSHAIGRPLEPEVLADAISDVLGIHDQYGSEPIGTRAVALFDSNIPSEALEILGRCSREESCEASAESTGGLPRKLHMFNGALLNRRIADSDGRLAKLLNAGKKPQEIVHEFYLRTFGRPPAPPEREFWRAQFEVDHTPDQRREILEDIVWSLLNHRDFTTIH